MKTTTVVQTEQKIETHIVQQSMVVLTLPEHHARFLRTLLGSLAPADFDEDTPPMNLVRDKFPDYLQLNHDIADSLMELLGCGIGGGETPINQEPTIPTFAKQDPYDYGEGIVLVSEDDPDY